MDIKQVTETIAMIEEQNFDVRTITMGISLLDCIDSDIDKAAEKVYNKIISKAKDLVTVGDEIAAELGIPIVNKRVSLLRFQSSVRQQMLQTMYLLRRRLTEQLRKSALTLLVVSLRSFKRVTKKVMRFLSILFHVRLLRLILSVRLSTLVQQRLVLT